MKYYLFIILHLTGSIFASFLTVYDREGRTEKSSVMALFSHFSEKTHLEMFTGKDTGYLIYCLAPEADRKSLFLSSIFFLRDPENS